MIELRSALVADAVSLAPRLRSFDLEELLRDEDSDACTALLDGILFSAESWAALWDGQVEVLGGIREDQEGHGVIWLLGSDRVKDHLREFLPISRGLCEEYLQRYDLVHNFVGANSHESKRYLRWLGFTIEPRVFTVGSKRVPFQYFWQRRGDANV